MSGTDDDIDTTSPANLVCISDLSLTLRPDVSEHAKEGLAARFH
jgi:hypothetical protein